MRLKSTTFLWIGGGLCVFGALLCAVTLALGGFDFMKITTTETYEDKIETVSLEDLQTIDLDIENQRIVFQPTTEPSVTVRYREFTDDEYTFIHQNGTFTMTYRSNEHWYQNFIHGVFSSIARGNQHIVVEIPAAYAGHLRARDTNSSITAENLPALASCELATTNGGLRLRNLTSPTLSASTTNSSVELDTVQTEALNVSSTNGGLRFRSVTVKGALTARTTNSSIELDSVTSGSVRLTSTNGHIEARDSRIDDVITAGTSNSHVTFERVKAAAADITTRNGGVQLNGCTLTNSAVARTTNSSIRVERLIARDIQLESTNGSIRGTIAGDQMDYSISTSTTNSSCTPTSVINRQATSSLSAVTTNSRIELTFVAP